MAVSRSGMQRGRLPPLRHTPEACREAAGGSPRAPRWLLALSVPRRSGEGGQGRRQPQRELAHHSGCPAVRQESCSHSLPKVGVGNHPGYSMSVHIPAHTHSPSSSTGRGRWAQQDPQEREDCRSSGTGTKPVSNWSVHSSAAGSPWDRARVPWTVTPRLPALGTTRGEWLGLGAGIDFAPTAGAWPAPCEQAGGVNRSSEVCCSPAFRRRAPESQPSAPTIRAFDTERK